MSSFTVARNAVLNLASFFITALVTFLLVPVMLRYLGPVGFGIWAVVRVLINYASLSDLGLTNAINKFVAEKDIRTDRGKIITLLASAFIIYLMITVFLWVIFIFSKDLIVDTFFSNAGIFKKDVEFLLVGSLGILSVNLISSITTSTFNGLQRMDITNGVASLFWMLNGILMYAALTTGWGLRGLVYANIASTVITNLINFIILARLIGRIDNKLSFVQFSEIKKLFRYGKHVFIGAVANSVYIHYDKLLLSSIVGLAPVASYEVASRVIQQMRQVPILLFNPLLPAASEMASRNDYEGIVRYYGTASKYLIVLLIPIFGIIGLFAEPLIRLWLGEGNTLISLTLQIFIISNFINLLTAPGYFITLGIGRPQYSMYISVVGLVSNLILSYVFLKLFGYFGVVAGTLTALTGSSILFLVMIHRTLGFQWAKYGKYFINPLISFISAGTVGWLFTAGVGSSLMGTASAILISIGIYLLLIWKLSYFTAEDKQFFLQFIQRIRGKIFPASYSERI